MYIKHNMAVSYQAHKKLIQLEELIREHKNKVKTPLERLKDAQNKGGEALRLRSLMNDDMARNKTKKGTSNYVVYFGLLMYLGSGIQFLMVRNYDPKIIEELKEKYFEIKSMLI